MKPITAEQKYEKWMYDQFQKAKIASFRKFKSLDDALDYIFVEMYGALKKVTDGHGLSLGYMAGETPSKKPVKKGKVVGKPKAEPGLFDTDTKFGVYVSAIKNGLNFSAPKSEWRKKEPGDVAKALGLKLSLEESRIFGKALKYVLKTETAKTYLVQPIKQTKACPLRNGRHGRRGIAPNLKGDNMSGFGCEVCECETEYGAANFAGYCKRCGGEVCVNCADKEYTKTGICRACREQLARDKRENDWSEEREQERQERSDEEYYSDESYYDPDSFYERNNLEESNEN